MNSVQSMITARKERLKQELRAEILAAARHLFVTEGYTAVSMRKVAERVGCAPGTLYLYFKDKDTILEAICVETFAKLDKRMESIRDDNSNPLERLRRGGRTYVHFGLDHPDHYFLTFALSAPSKDNHAEAKHAGEHSFDCLRKCVAMARDAGLLRKTDVEEVAQCLWAAMHGIVMLLIASPGFPYIEQNRLIDAALDMAIEGIRKQ
jgi:AcrR family transcriptional regulator